MRLVTYEHDGVQRAGVDCEGHLVDGARAAREAGFRIEDAHDGIPARRLLEVCGQELVALGEAARRIASEADDAGSLATSHVTLGAPVADPDKILCVGLNYIDHADETEFEPPESPVIFAKFRNSLIGPGAPIHLPRICSEQVDYEGEVAVVISRRCKQVEAADALEFVAGVMPFNDVSARDLQMQSSQWTPGKAIDTFGPCGPALVTLDELEDVRDLRLSTRLNGETVQTASTASMIFPIPALIAWLSRLMTLEPGDVIATGTPAGVGYTRNPPTYLKQGDEVEVEVEGVGVLRNGIVADGAKREDAEHG